MKKNTVNHEPQNLKRVRALRSNMTVSEQVLWRHLRGKRCGFAFRRQYPVGPYVLDFYCPEAALCVEVDGEQHGESKNRDEARDRWLASRGLMTIRIPSLALFGELESSLQESLERIVVACQERTGRDAFEFP